MYFRERLAITGSSRRKQKLLVNQGEQRSLILKGEQRSPVLLREQRLLVIQGARKDYLVLQGERRYHWYFRQRAQIIGTSGRAGITSI